MFIGRQKETEALNAFYEGNTEAVACVTGSMGMGKTALLRHFAENKEHIYFCAYETTGRQELTLFAEAAGLQQAERLEDILDAITAKGKKGKLLLMIDQYPNCVKAEADVNQIFFSYVTKEWADLPIKVILCDGEVCLWEKGTVEGFHRCAFEVTGHVFSGDKAVLRGRIVGGYGAVLRNQWRYSGPCGADAGSDTERGGTCCLL